jgi:phosphate transport system protein
MRIQFDEQLERLNLELIKMGALCEDAISIAIEGLLDRDSALLDKVSAAESEIDQKGRDIESLCMKLLLQQQPVARDLRQISAALKMISDMERIGDQADDIAEISRHIMGQAAVGETHLREMSVEVIKMVTDSIDSFVKKDLAIAQQVIQRDDIVDHYFDAVKGELIALIAAGSAKGECYIDILMIAKYLERIGDHATNIAEWVEYSVQGTHAKK